MLPLLFGRLKHRRDLDPWGLVRFWVGNIEVDHATIDQHPNDFGFVHALWQRSDGDPTNNSQIKIADVGVRGLLLCHSCSTSKICAMVGFVSVICLTLCIDPYWVLLGWRYHVTHFCSKLT